ncbi:type I phosphodiesterase/nucleotide pyrophosphatase [Chitinophaga skermanii]|uniref:Type I phosphodiesterase/nucleotide pyrophosphatase n=1 Tax=Chitinophaga skermanii TaxID=331697 RepID=A0A327Q4Q9_9BACT|nr:alkaline phosphatase [Chitinophaga skermanii]RAI99370.1 type I phosphodiesterase/nucleotide pyrophosphatase [Chitinophaga skermanii]
MKKLVIAAALLCCGLYTKAQVKGIKHVILIGMDGLGAYAIPESRVPNMQQMMQHGSWTLQARSVLPSSSAVNWASMVMGAGPEIHGYTEWNSQTPELPSRVLDKYGLFPSIYTLIREAKPAAEIGVIYTWEGIGALFPKAAVNKDQHCDNDSATTEAALAYMTAKKPDFLFIHFDEPDHTGHTTGHKNATYYEQVHRQDSLLGKLLEGIKAAGMWENSIVILTADHGGINKGHGGKTMQEMQIPWIMVGKGVLENHELKESIMTYDTAATIAYIFGLKIPQAWIGRTINAFKR